MQTSFSFDGESVKKMLKGALYALSVPAAFGLLDYLGKLQFSNAAIALFVAWIIPVLVNIVKEWAAGIPS